MICPICNREIPQPGECRKCENVVPIHASLPSADQWMAELYPNVNGEPLLDGEPLQVKDESRLKDYVGMLTNKMLEVEILTGELARRTKTLEQKIREVDEIVQKVLATTQ